jgi:predicted transcriptional regulator
MSGIQDYMIFRIIADSNGKVTKKEIIDKLGRDKETKRVVEEKLSMMERFGLISIEGDLVVLKKR